MSQSHTESEPVHVDLDALRREIHPEGKSTSLREWFKRLRTCIEADEKKALSDDLGVKK
jgi:hypothetical protein